MFRPPPPPPPPEEYSFRFPICSSAHELPLQAPPSSPPPRQPTASLSTNLLSRKVCNKKVALESLRAAGADPPRHQPARISPRFPSQSDRRTPRRLTANVLGNQRVQPMPIEHRQFCTDSVTAYPLEALTPSDLRFNGLRDSNGSNDTAWRSSNVSETARDSCLHSRIADGGGVLRRCPGSLQLPTLTSSPSSSSVFGKSPHPKILLGEAPPPCPSPLSNDETREKASMSLLSCVSAFVDSAADVSRPSASNRSASSTNSRACFPISDRACPRVSPPPPTAPRKQRTTAIGDNNHSLGPPPPVARLPDAIFSASLSTQQPRQPSHPLVQHTHHLQQQPAHPPPLRQHTHHLQQQQPTHPPLRQHTHHLQQQHTHRLQQQQPIHQLRQHTHQLRAPIPTFVPSISLPPPSSCSPVPFLPGLESLAPPFHPMSVMPSLVPLVRPIHKLDQSVNPLHPLNQLQPHRTLDTGRRFVTPLSVHPLLQRFHGVVDPSLNSHARRDPWGLCTGGTQWMKEPVRNGAFCCPNPNSLSNSAFCCGLKDL
eukprot:GHVS01077227.1.p1 GENE.GHVS01077227.1~~GHVS01077227.1.p1  ORF type:complete len:540 (+),score=81.92 GHVS01077227.1:579-2198(+)